MTKMHTVPKVGALPVGIDWESGNWCNVPALTIDEFREESCDHRPLAEVKVVHDGRVVKVLYRVRDTYVRAAPRQFQGAVCRDSCVELFVRPTPGKGYVNIETNCGGVLHASYIEDWTRMVDGFAKRTMLSESQAQSIQVTSSLPSIVDPERVGPTTWSVGVTFPVDVLEPFVGTLGELSGSKWSANFYKCGDDTSHPHWASWSPVSELNFHCPKDFGQLCFQ